jgi:hypothetical protein
MLRKSSPFSKLKTYKMKKIILVLALTLFSNWAFCQDTLTNNSRDFDPKLVGCWKGSEEDQQQEGLKKYWISCRFEDGTSTLLFIAVDAEGQVTQQTENGKWWVEDGKYYELHNFDKVIDIYDYEVLDDSVKFSSIEVMGNKDANYSFYDYKIEDN